jgi:Abnormal spindle-like microcephaly-assoc'd, ASPM-SPD-2-Hydin
LKVSHVVAVGIWIVVQLLFSAAIHSQTAPAPTGLQVSPAAIDFGDVAITADGPTRTVTVNNSTSSPVSIEQIIVSGIDFSEKHDCGLSLAPGAQCTIQVSFTPAISGPRTGNLGVMESNGNAHIVALNGTGK